MGVRDSLRVVYHHCADLIFAVRADGKDLLQGTIIYVNRAFCDFTGLERCEIEGQPARSLVAGELPQLDRWKQPEASGSTPPALTLHLKRKDTSEFPATFETWLICDPAGGSDCVIFRHLGRPAPALIQTQAVSQGTHACIFTTDLDCNVTTWNEGAARATGFSAAEMVGRNIEVLSTSSGSRCRPDDLLPRLLKEGSFDFRLPLRKKDGGTSHQAFCSSLLRDESGAPCGILSISLDITDVMRHDEALQESSRLWEAIQRLQQSSMSGGDARAVMQESLSALMQMTGSIHGFCGDVHTDTKGQSYVRAETIQTSSKEPSALEFFRPYLNQGFEFRKKDSLIWRAIDERKAVLSDAPASDPRGIGFPGGHPFLTSFAGIPLVTAKGVIAIVGLANRPGGYDQELLSRLQPLLDCCAHLIEFSRARDNASLLATMFQRGFENSHEALVIANLDGEIVDWNPQAEKLFGCRRSGAVGTDLMTTCGRSSSLSYSSISATILKYGYWEDVISFHGPTEAETTVEMSGFPVAADGAPLFMFVMRDITWRKRAEEALQEASHRFDAFAQNSRCAFWLAEADTKRVLYTSPALRTIAGLEPPLDTKVWERMIHPDDYPAFRTMVARFCEGGLTTQHKYRIILADGRIRWIQSSAFPVRDATGKIYRLAGLMEDVTGYEEAVAKLHLALSEKEALLKEIHHRVKNNLQIISSLLRLQATSTHDPDSIACLEESRNRVDTIALLHEYLHQSENLSGINFSTYIRRLVTKLMSVNPAADTVDVEFHLEAVILDSQTTVLCGLVLNELVSNSLRHAFRRGQRGKIRIRVRSDRDNVFMTISDNGNGLPPGFDLERVDTLGLRLVQRLIRQLHGTVSISDECGVKVDVAFPLPSTGLDRVESA